MLAFLFCFGHSNRRNGDSLHGFTHIHAHAREGRPIRGAHRLQIRTTGSGAELPAPITGKP